MNSIDVITSSEMLEEALRQATRGHPILPIHGVTQGHCGCGKPNCPSAGKHPATVHGVKYATIDHETIRQWFGSSPCLNLAIATGEISGLIAADIDPRNGGDEGLAGLERLHGKLPQTVEVATGGGGRHLFFKYPEGLYVPSSHGNVAQGVDIQALNAYVVSPPSIHLSGGKYSYLDSRDFGSIKLAQPPAWLLDMVVKERSSQAEPGASIIEARRGFIPLGRAALDFVSNGTPIGQQRNRALAATRNYLSAGWSIEDTASKIWEGLKASEWIESKPWTHRDAYDMAVDLSNTPRPSRNQSSRQDRKIKFDTVEI